MSKAKFEDVDDVQGDVQQLARELWVINEKIREKLEEQSELRQVMKALKTSREDLIKKISKCGQFTVVDGRRSA